ncbi:hypothetical protein JTB14_017562 [Gonioctena quinquepunctata]|nr:hypothetical protein JTB14_017562 [Gonioctena quinquepunctata]
MAICQRPSSWRKRNIKRKQLEIENSKEQESDFRKVTYKKSRPRKNLATAEVSEEDNNNGFSGGERKVWLYVYRVKRAATEEQIMNYLTKTPGFDRNNTQVKEIRSSTNQLKRFLVTAPLDKKDLVYQPEFWPQNVGVKRFDFEKNRKFLNYIGGHF